MWLTEELQRCRDLYRDLPDVKPGDLLESDEVNLIGPKAAAWFNLRNRIMTPKNQYSWSTVTFQRLWDENMDFGSWLESIAKTVLFTERTHVQVGFSFLCWNPITKEKIYIWAARGLSPYDFYCNNHEECMDRFEKIGRLSAGDLLQKTFVEEQEDNPFGMSGYGPLKMICTYVWIKK